VRLAAAAQLANGHRQRRPAGARIAVGAGVLAAIWAIAWPVFPAVRAGPARAATAVRSAR